MNHPTLIRDNFIAKATYFAKMVPGMAVMENESAVWVDCGLPSDTFNVGILKDIPPAPGEADITSVIEHFAAKHFPFALWNFNTSNDNQIKETLAEYQLLETEINAGMWADLQSIPAEYPEREDFTVKRVTTPEEVKKFSAALASLFEPSDEAAQIRAYFEQITPYYHSETSSHQFYLGISEGEVVSTGALFFTAQSVGIYDITTQEALRGRGFGTLMFQALLHEAKQRGATVAILQSSPDGLSIYKRSGFVEVSSATVFEKRDLP